MSTGTADMAVVVSMEEDVSSKMPNVTNSVGASATSMRQLAMGTMYLGTTFIGLGVAMERSNNDMLQSVGNMLAMAGGITTAIGSAAKFVEAAAKIAKALDGINIRLILQKALSGPAGWALLAGAVAVGGASIYGVNRMSQSQEIKVQNNMTVNMDGKKVGAGVRTNIIKTSMQNANANGLTN